MYQKYRNQLLLVTLAIMGSMVVLHAQSNSRFGIKAGFNLSNMYANEVNDKNATLGIHGGVFLKAAISKHLSLQPELLYTMKGAELQYQNGFVTGSGKFALNYLEVPVLAVVQITPFLNLQAGVYGATLTSVKLTNKSTIDNFNFETELQKSNFETIDYGFVAGLGVDFKVLSMGLRYEHGMKTVGKTKTIAGQNYLFPDARNANLQLYVGFSIL
jgi:Outer membrane protein beta-barrel domain